MTYPFHHQFCRTVRPKDRHLAICPEGLRHGSFFRHVWSSPCVRPTSQMKKVFIYCCSCSSEGDNSSFLSYIKYFYCNCSTLASSNLSLVAVSFSPSLDDSGRRKWSRGTPMSMSCFHKISMRSASCKKRIESYITHGCHVCRVLNYTSPYRENM